MAQQKKTGSLRIEELPDLTEQQSLFVRGLLDGKTGSDAYRAAYDCRNMRPETVWASASRLRHDPKVTAWLLAARLAKLGNARLTLDDHMTELERLREIALETGNIGAAVQAEQIRGKAAGLHIEKHQDVTPDPLDALREIERHDPDLAQRLADRDGIKLH